MKKYLHFLIPLLVVVIGGFAIVANVRADEYGLDLTAQKAGLNKEGDLTAVIGNVIGTALSMVAVLFFGLMLYGGILWMTDRGNEEQSKKALNTITAAVIGIIIVLASYAITNFVFKSAGAFGGGGGSPTPAPEVGGCCAYTGVRGARDFDGQRFVTDNDACQAVCNEEGNTPGSCNFVENIPRADCGAGTL